ncbi:FHA domain-containing protein [Vibrio spartinae]|uniref:FHA domain protein n=1 Tax=Vibrio spartinae TaxID=1918945 RepID=A0A1N6M743_9VIBR|nr:FHA domain-containing protein [Vibrio spartinae]QMV13916.1 hypothetical protein Vspart_01163 [Vibrio spartinae]SIO95180.1 FHA domain protein [Vibrio spartinae]
MAYLSNIRLEHPIYLKAFHQIGRLSSAVDTTINLPDVSRIHAIIEFKKHWYIRDLSKNGVRVNGERLETHCPYQLKRGDQIWFSSAQKEPFVIASLEPPKDILLPAYHDNNESHHLEPIYLKRYHFLPDDTSPELVVIYDQENQEWQCEHLTSSQCYVLKDGEQLEFSNKAWRLFKGAHSEEQETEYLDAQPDSNFRYIFNISQDEELTELTIKDSQRCIDCQTRSHHYLTALLARYKAEDLRQNIPEPSQGWRSVDQLTKDMGISETHINIQIHRARKQLAELQETMGVMVPNIIERKRGRIRLAATNYQVIKGNQLEIDSSHWLN